jgi:capsular polysaccharide biosynthesis protein
MWRWLGRYEWNRVFRELVVAVVLVALGVTMVSLLQPPTYEASTEVWVDQQLGNQGKNLAGSGEEIQPLPNPGEDLQSLMPTMTHAIETRPVAEEALRYMGLRMEPAELLNNLTVEHLEGTSFIRLTYEGTNPVLATHIVNTMAEVSSERISETSRTAGSDLTASVYEKAVVPDNPTPVSPHPLRNGLLTLVTGLVLCVGLVVALPGVAASVADKRGGQAVRQGVGQAGVLGRWHRDNSIVERIKEKKLLRTLGRRGKLTAVEAALATSLSVEEANRMLFELAAKGHLEVTVEHGKLLYSFWEHGA